MLHRSPEHDGLAIIDISVRLDHQDAQAHHFQAQRGVDNLGHQVGKSSWIDAARIGPGHLRSVEQVVAEVVDDGVPSNWACCRATR